MGEKRVRRYFLGRRANISEGLGEQQVPQNTCAGGGHLTPPHAMLIRLRVARHQARGLQRGCWCKGNS